MNPIIRNIFYIGLTLAMVCCTAENLPEDKSWQGDNTIELKLLPDNSITRSITEPVDEGTREDYVVSDFIIFQFDENGIRIVDPQYYSYTPDENGTQTIPIVLPQKGKKHTIVVLANYHNTLANTSFASYTTLDKLMKAYKRFEDLEDTYQINGDTRDLLMNGFAEIDENAKNLDIELFRNVAKFSFSIKNNESSGVIIKTIQVKSVASKIDYFTRLLEVKQPDLFSTTYPDNSFRTFDYEPEEIEIRPGDSKNLLYYLPCNVRGTSELSDEKTKGNYAPDKATFIQLYGVSEDGSKFLNYTFFLGKNMKNDFNILPNHHYTLPLVFNSIGNPQNDSRVQIADAIQVEQEANSFIINPLPTEEQKTYNIPVANRINTFWNSEALIGNIATSTGYTISKDDEWSADIIWQTSNTQMIQFVETNGNITDNNGLASPNYSGICALRIKPLKGAEGNVLVGVYRKDQAEGVKEYSWSFHLWITDYNPDEANNQNWENRYKYVLRNNSGEVHRYNTTAWNNVDGPYYNKWIMDRNLGALGNDGYSDSNTKARGLYYQFGNKEPYSYPKVYYYNGSNFVTRNFSTISKANWIHDIIKKPYYYANNGHDFLVNNPYANNKWDDPEWNKEMNGGTTNKSFFDPCPPGWRVPEVNAFYDLNYGNRTSIGLYTFFDNINGSENRAWFPIAGGFNGFRGLAWTDFILARTSTPSTLSLSWAILSGAGSVKISPSNNPGNSGGRGRAMNVRCIQE